MRINERGIFMPTGYTAAIAKGITFEQFAMDCARAFGATISMRDEPAGTPIPDEFKPSEYHKDAINSAKAELALLQKMSHADIEKSAADEHEKAEAHRLQRLSEVRALRVKYESMLAQAVDWVPPSVDHEEMKSFMIQQITSSIDFDTCEDYYLTPSSRQTGQQWHARRIRVITDNIAYHAKSHAEEMERCAKRTEWVRKLRESLKPAQEAP